MQFIVRKFKALALAGLLFGKWSDHQMTTGQQFWLLPSLSYNQWGNWAILCKWVVGWLLALTQQEALKKREALNKREALSESAFNAFSLNK